MTEAIVEAMRCAVPTSEIAAQFHNTLVAMILAVAQAAGEKQVVLSGGCFQNRLLLERTVAALRGNGFHPYWHEQVPTNDGGIALGQVMAAVREHQPCV